jgi:hypothetical protein
LPVVEPVAVTAATQIISVVVVVELVGFFLDQTQQQLQLFPELLTQ